MKRYLFKIILMVVVLCAALLGLVYWYYEYRPDEIRELCANELKVIEPHKQPGEEFHRRKRTYQQCLQEHGITR